MQNVIRCVSHRVSVGLYVGPKIGAAPSRNAPISDMLVPNLDVLDQTVRAYVRWSARKSFAPLRTAFSGSLKVIGTGMGQSATYMTSY